MIPFNKPYLVGEEIQYISNSLNSLHLAGDGHYTKLCSNWLEEKLKTKKALLTTSCTSALEMAIILSGIGINDEVIIPSYTFVSSANSVVMRGGTPVFVDIDPITLNIDVDIIESAITEKTKAILVVHYAGFSCDMRKLMSLAKKYNLIVIEDAAQSILAKYDDDYLGTIGHFGCLSFHETKNITCGEGGAILINDDNYIERAEIIREKGTNRSKFFRGQIDKYTWCDIGSSFLSSDILSSFLYVQLLNSDLITQKRRELWYRYYENLKDNKNFKIVNDLSYNFHNAHMFYLLFKNLEERTLFQNFLKSNNIISTFHYIPLHSSIAGKKYGREGSSMLVTNNVSDCLLRLPMWIGMDIEYILNHIKSYKIS